MLLMEHFLIFYGSYSQIFEKLCGYKDKLFKKYKKYIYDLNKSKG